MHFFKTKQTQNKNRNRAPLHSPPPNPGKIKKLGSDAFNAIFYSQLSINLHIYRCFNLHAHIQSLNFQKRSIAVNSSLVQ